MATVTSFAAFTTSLLSALTVDDLLARIPLALTGVLDRHCAYGVNLFEDSSCAGAIAEQNHRARLCIPLVDDGQAIGAIVVGAPDPWRGWEQEDALVAGVASVLAAMIVARQRTAAAQAQLVQEAAGLRFEAVSMLSHEMRTPLASIKGYATALLLEEAEWDDATRVEFLQTIDEEADRLTRLIEDILEGAAIDAGELQIVPEPVLIPRIAKRLVDRLAMQTRQHRFVIRFPVDFPTVEADAQRIEQVLTNLVDNAVKYSPDGGLIVVHGEVRPNEVVVSVVDQGVGIAPEDLNKLFERFFRASTSRPHVVGTGLGLPISDLIVRGHGGRIWAESTVGSGTTLSFTLPHPRPRERRTARQG